VDLNSNLFGGVSEFFGGGERVADVRVLNSVAVEGEATGGNIDRVCADGHGTGSPVWAEATDGGGGETDRDLECGEPESHGRVGDSVRW
jgi:hypothetical protein